MLTGFEYVFKLPRSGNRRVCESVDLGIHVHTTGAACGRFARLDGVLGGGCLLTRAVGEITLDGVEGRDILK